MHLAASTSLPMLSRHSPSSTFLFTISKTLSLLSRRPFPRHHVPHCHALAAPRPLHSAPCFLSLRTTRAGKRPPRTFHQQRHQHHMSDESPKSPGGPKSPGSGAAVGGGLSRKAMNRFLRESPEGVLRHKLDMCSKRGELLEALRLYDEARAQGVPLSRHHYNVLLYLCSSPSPSPGRGAGEADPALTPSPETARLGVQRGFEIFCEMGLDSVPPNEATFTSVARLAAVKEDPELAFQLIEQMVSSGIPPRLRSYGPALLGFCKKGDADKAYEVESHMARSGVLPEEADLSALLQVSADVGKGDQVYRLMHRLRSTVRQVSVFTAEVVEGWFRSDAAGRVGLEEWDIEKVNEGVVSGGGGWHGQGWLGTGPWSVGRTGVDETGICRRCGEKLTCIDIDPAETENFARSLSTLACQREARADFSSFQEWLDQHGPFDAVIDGANIGLYNQHNFSFFQLNSVVNGIRQMSPTKKMPLIILHSRRVKGEPADKPNNRKLIERWQKSGALYTTPPGSNDDWYWLYAAVSCRCLLVTNDEMRDHLFELLGTSFFPRWKEKHQVRLTVSKHGPKFHMPPPYSIVIQESVGGSWHVPTVSGDDIETPREWICATRGAAKLSPALSPLQQLQHAPRGFLI